MIYVEIREDHIRVIGHAGFAPKGFSLPCAAVSALTLVLLRGLSDVAHMDTEGSAVRDGYVIIVWKAMQPIGKALIDAWKIGMEEIQEAYQCITFI